MGQSYVVVAPNGRMVIPAAVRETLGVKLGGKLVARVENGTLILEPIEASVRRAQALVAQYITPNSGVVDEFIAERHAAAELE